MNLRKIGLLTLSMSAIFMASSCNKASEKVTEEEFNKAVSFEGVEYLQTNQTMKMEMSMTMEGKTIEMKMEEVLKQKLSPGVSHTISTTEGDVPTPSSITEKTKTYEETYATAKDKKVAYIYRDKEDGDFSKETTISIEEAKTQGIYCTPQESTVALLIKNSGLTFKDFAYKSDAYVASNTIKDPSTGTELDATTKLFFENKKVARITVSGGAEEESKGMKITLNVNMPLTYKKVVPPKPTK